MIQKYLKSIDDALKYLNVKRRKKIVWDDENFWIAFKNEKQKHVLSNILMRHRSNFDIIASFKSSKWILHYDVFDMLSYVMRTMSVDIVNFVEILLRKFEFWFATHVTTFLFDRTKMSHKHVIKHVCFFFKNFLNIHDHINKLNFIAIMNLKIFIENNYIFMKIFWKYVQFIANNNKYAIIKRRNKNDDLTHQLKNVDIFCDRDREFKSKTNVSRIKKTINVKCHCSFKFIARYKKFIDVWILTIKNNQHNHEIIKSNVFAINRNHYAHINNMKKIVKHVTKTN